MHTMASEDTEITLGVGKLLGLFLLLAAICAIFFSIGFSLGKTSGHEQAVNDQPVTAAVSADSGTSTSNSNDPKPSAAVATKSDPDSLPAPASTTTDQQGSLTFYNAVKQNDKAQQAANESKAAADQATGPKVVAAAAPALATAPAPQPTAATARGSEVMSHTSPVTGPGTMVVQIAAVSREDDAVALAGALRKKNYNVFVVNNPVTNDKLYHVQVGPFSTMADAEAMKAKLVAEGYNPIIKK